MERNIRPRFGPKQNGFRSHLTSGRINGHTDGWFPSGRPPSGEEAAIRWRRELRCPLLVKSRHLQRKRHVRFTTKSGDARQRRPRAVSASRVRNKLFSSNDSLPRSVEEVTLWRRPTPYRPD